MKISKFLVTTGFAVLMTNGLFSSLVSDDGPFDLGSVQSRLRAFNETDTEAAALALAAQLHKDRARISRMQDDIASLSRSPSHGRSLEISPARSDVEEKRVHQELQEEYQRITTAHARSVDECGRNREELDKVKQKSALLEGELVTVLAQKKLADEQLVQLRADLESVRSAQQQVVSAELQQALGAVDKKTKECADLTAKSQLIDGELRKVKADLEREHSEKAKAEARFRELEAEKNRIAEQLKGATVRLDQANTELTNSRKAKDDLQRAMAELSSKAQNFEAELTTARSALDHLRSSAIGSAQSPRALSSLSHGSPNLRALPDAKYDELETKYSSIVEQLKIASDELERLRPFADRCKEVEGKLKGYVVFEQTSTDEISKLRGRVVAAESQYRELHRLNEALKAEAQQRSQFDRAQSPQLVRTMFAPVADASGTLSVDQPMAKAFACRQIDGFVGEVMQRINAQYPSRDGKVISSKVGQEAYQGLTRDIFTERLLEWGEATKGKVDSGAVVLPDRLTNASADDLDNHAALRVNILDVLTVELERFVLNITKASSVKEDVKFFVTDQKKHHASDARPTFPTGKQPDVMDALAKIMGTNRVTAIKSYGARI